MSFTSFFFLLLASKENDKKMESFFSNFVRRYQPDIFEYIPLFVQLIRSALMTVVKAELSPTEPRNFDISNFDRYRSKTTKKKETARRNGRQNLIIRSSPPALVSLRNATYIPRALSLSVFCSLVRAHALSTRRCTQLYDTLYTHRHSLATATNFYVGDDDDDDDAHRCTSSSMVPSSCRCRSRTTDCRSARGPLA